MGKYLREAANELEDLATRLRQEAVVSMRRQDMTFTAIGAELGISKQAARQMWLKAQEREEASA